MWWNAINVFILLMMREAEMANILALFPLPVYSHTNNFIPIIKALAARGHNVTMISPYPQKIPVPNLIEIEVKSNVGNFSANMPIVDLTKISERYFQFYEFWNFGSKLADMAVNIDVVRNLIKDQTSRFDLVMIETFIFQESYLAFGYKFNAPIINMHPSILPASAAWYTGNQVPFSSSPGRFSTFSDHMTFLERAESTFFHVWDILISRLYIARRQDYLMRKYLQPPELPALPPITEMLMNTSLTLIHHNSAVGYPFPVHKNIIEFAGADIKKTGKLPDDLKKIMDNASNGVIYFSFGSFLNLSTLSPKIQTSILSALSKVKLTVLIKRQPPPDNQTMPANIIFRDWYPQPDVLAHPNCKLFITHGGISSLIEAIYHAVPMVLIPLFADQKYNAKFVETNGLGKVLTLKYVNEENLLTAIETVLNNPSYKDKVQSRSAIFRDNPMEIMDKVIYWIEYVIRHKGAPHLKPAVLDLYWFQAMCLDVIVFCLFIVLIVVFLLLQVILISIRSIRYLFSKVTKKSKKSSKPKRE